MHMVKKILRITSKRIEIEFVSSIIMQGGKEIQNMKENIGEKTLENKQDKSSTQNKMLEIYVHKIKC